MTITEMWQLDDKLDTVCHELAKVKEDLKYRKPMIGEPSIKDIHDLQLRIRKAQRQLSMLTVNKSEIELFDFLEEECPEL